MKEEEKHCRQDADDVDEGDERHEEVEAALLAGQAVRLQLVLRVPSVIVLAEDAHEGRAVIWYNELD